MTAIQIVSLGLLALFYAVYLGKMIAQRRRGIRTDLLGAAGKPKRERMIEATLKVMTYSTVAVEALLGNVFRIILVSQPRIKNDGLCFDISDKIVVDVNVAFLVIVHGIAFADLNFLNQPYQRGTV